jgi:hypothetical protein
VFGGEILPGNTYPKRKYNLIGMEIIMDDSQQSITEPQQEQPPIPEIVLPSQSKRSNKKYWVISGIALGVLCLCSVLCITLVALGANKIKSEEAPVISVIDSYMRFMVARDADSAYALFSPRMRRQFPISKAEELLEGNNYFVFEGYRSLNLNNLNISKDLNTNPDLPQGTVARVTGTITYEGGIQGTFTATLEKVDGKWLIYSINNDIPPSKIK